MSSTEYKILVVDDQPSIRAMLEDFLEERYSVSTASDAEAALAACASTSFDLVISDINMPGMKGPELLHQIKQLYPKTKILLITAYDVDEYVRLAKTYGISNIVPKTAPFNFPELDAVISALVTGNIFGIDRYLEPGFRSLGSYCIRSTEEAQTVRDEIYTMFCEQFGTAGEMKLLLDEIITNAVFHAPANLDGSDKYTEFVPIALLPDEYITVECAADSEKYGVAVIDNKGRLTRETVLFKLDRQIGGEGVLDDSGRGIHMSRLFSDRMIINIAPLIKTEVILMNYFSPKYRGFKPLYINEL